MKEFIFDGSATMANDFFGERYGIDWECFTPGSEDIRVPRANGCPVVKKGEVIPLSLIDTHSLADFFKRDSGHKNHWSDCSTNNCGIPELLGPCDCGGVDKEN